MSESIISNMVHMLEHTCDAAACTVAASGLPARELLHSCIHCWATPCIKPANLLEVCWGGQLPAWRVCRNAAVQTTCIYAVAHLTTMSTDLQCWPANTVCRLLAAAGGGRRARRNLLLLFEAAAMLAASVCLY
jgi:hypothetical protein